MIQCKHNYSREIIMMGEKLKVCLCGIAMCFIIALGFALAYMV